MTGRAPSVMGMGPGLSAQATRREALRAGAAGLLALGDGSPLGSWRSGADGERSVILVVMVGGASAAETFDPRPDAPTERRGPFGSIATRVPGVRVVDHLPRLAQRLDRVTLIRSLQHEADPTHAAGLQILSTGSSEPGSVPLSTRVATDLGVRSGMPPVVVLPQPVGPSGAAPQSQPSGTRLAAAVEPFVVGGVPGAAGWDARRLGGRLERWADRAVAVGLPARGGIGPISRSLADWASANPQEQTSFGPSEFGRSCWLAARLVAAGARLVTIPMARTVFGQPSWDAHGRTPWSTWDDYEQTLLPSFDAGMAALVDHLGASGRLRSTLVVATGEQGRTPWINESGGRDHWPAAWSGLVAGGGTAGGRVVGATDSHGQITDGPVPLADLVALIGHHLGLDPDPDPTGSAGANLARLLA